MKFTDALQVAHQIPWSRPNTFEVYFAWNWKMLNNSNAPQDTVDYANESKVQRGNILAWSPQDNERLSLHLKELKLPQIGAASLNSFAGNRWAHNYGTPEQYKFDMTFYDSNQMEFYKMFSAQFREQSYRYFDDYTFNVFISKDSDYGDGYHNDTTGYGETSWRSQPLMSLKRCSIESIGPINFSNSTENQILEFTVNFVANDMEMYDQGARQFYGGWEEWKHSRQMSHFSAAAK